MSDHTIAEVENRACVVSELWEHLSRSWALQILGELIAGETVRFNELKRKLTGITATTLSERLKEFENDGLITRRIYPEIPPRVEYSLTEDGKELSKIIGQLDKWIRSRQSKKLS